jgi:hypothetical protein
MNSDNPDWNLDALGRQVGPYKDDVLDLQSRVDWSERFVSQHERDIKQARYETAQSSQQLEKRIQEQGRLIRGQQRLVGFLAEVLFAVSGVLLGGLVSACVQGDIYWTVGSGLFVFLVTVLVGNLLYRRLAASLISEPAAQRIKKRRNRHHEP